MISNEKMLKITNELGVLTDEAVSHLEKGKEYAYKNKNKDAVNEYTSAIEIFIKAEERCAKVRNSHSVIEFQCLQQTGMLSMCYYYRGLSQAEEKNYPQAIKDFNKTMETYPEHQSCLTNRGKAYIKEGQLDKALADITRASKLLPDDPEPYFYLAIVYSAQKKEKEALESLNKTAELVLKDERGSASDINDYRKTWYNQISREPDFKNLSKDKQFRELLKTLQQRYYKK